MPPRAQGHPQVPQDRMRLSESTSLWSRHCWPFRLPLFLPLLALRRTLQSERRHVAGEIQARSRELYLWATFWGLFWMAAFPIIVLLFVGFMCAVGLGCFFADHNLITGWCSQPSWGFLGGFGEVLSRAEKRWQERAG